MPPLKNIKHERFCIGLSSGYSQRDAAIKVGYKDNSNTSKLMNKPDIQERLKELKQLQEDQFVKSRAEILIALGKIIDKGSDGNKIRACQLAAHMQGFLEDTINLKSEKKATELSDEELEGFLAGVK